MKKILLCGMALTLAACNSTPEKNVLHPKENISNYIDNKTFIINVVNNEEIPYYKGLNIGFKINNSTNIHFATGNLGCNRFFANYKVEDDKILFDDIKTTKAVCKKEDLERSVSIINLLKEGVDFSINQNNYVLSSGEKNIQLKTRKKIKK